MKRAYLSLTLAMTVFGTIGLFRRALPLPSGMLALSRGVVGMLFLLLFIILRGQRLDRAAIAAHRWPLLVSGAMIGVNWILLFEAYRYTTVATATLCYYMAPIFVLLASPLFGEKLSARRAGCIVVALGGMVLISGVLDRAGGLAAGELTGVALGLGAALFYAGVILTNQRLRAVPAYDKTIVQLGAASVVLVPYSLLTEDWGAVAFTPAIIVALLVVGVVHTGIAYALYFGSMGSLPAQTVALFGYIDPIVAILLSALVLHEPMGAAEWLGAVLVLGATAVSELGPRKERKTE